MLNQQLRFDSLIPFFASTGWLVGVFLAMDAVLALTLGATFGEFLMGLRVTALDDRRLSLTQRQDRTTDALVEGTLGCVPLLARFWRRENAPYDASCKVVFLGLGAPQLALSTLVLLTSLLTGAALASDRGRDLLSSAAPAGLVILLDRIGLKVGESWRNTYSGTAVKLPSGWRLAFVEQHRLEGQRVSFEKGSRPDCRVDIFRYTSETLLLPKPAVEGLPRRLLHSLGVVVSSDEPMTYEVRAQGAELFQDMRVFDGVFDDGSDIGQKAENARTDPTVRSYVWFTRGRDWWTVMHYLMPSCEDPGGPANLVVALINSTQPAK